ncbi:uncharacterized protein LOC130766005 isoform X2 [Actinidia eriantha]|uniref:uncharacterized protein LOC130766005 isoform X2 n=1 Tax=Actinidia eriantha TaxID=165200 RepID=UPI00258EF9C7|nr:uncharacterized protein LOC130766005 isoform X2 [Actinidia eriantha]XP_057478636.1 uncharacterized protein LOC130766005 isoform X2 [Actinidia eriantha]
MPFFSVSYSKTSLNTSNSGLLVLCFVFCLNLQKILIDAVNSMDLMDPSRSTLNDENVSSHAFVTLEEVVKDLEYLNWKECCVTSIKTLNSVNYDLVLRNSGASPTKSEAKKSTKRRKLPRLRDVTATADNGSQSVCSSAVGKGSRSTTLVPRRIASNVTGDGDFSATFGEVITMHGFKKIRNTPKKILIDAMNSMDLMDPSRSTLNDENVSSHAFVTLEEVVKDLEYLNWKECCVTSIKTLNSVNYDLVLRNNGSSPTKSKAKKSTKRRKLPQLRDVTATADNGSQSVCSSAVGKGSRSTTLVPRRIASNVTGDGDFSATFGEVITARIV